MEPLGAQNVKEFHDPAVPGRALRDAGCSVKRFAINKLGDSLANSGTTYAADDDPDLVGQALPFSLKLVEGLLAESPEHRRLLFTAASGFTEYAYIYVQQEADLIEKQDLDKATALRNRARRLYLRARGYGLRGLDVRTHGFSRKLRDDPASAVGLANMSDVPLLYWTAAAWGAAVGLSEDNAGLIADQRIVEALIDRALALDPDARPEWRLQNLVVQRRARWLLATEDDLFLK